MSPRKRDVTLRSTPRRFAARLRRIADAIESGRPFTVQVGGEALRVPADARLSVEHERERGVEEVEFQFRWKSARPRTRR
jgi:amphi-Trp domain-containing protein